LMPMTSICGPCPTYPIDESCKTTARVGSQSAPIGTQSRRQTCKPAQYLEVACGWGSRRGAETQGHYLPLPSIERRHCSMPSYSEPKPAASSLPKSTAMARCGRCTRTCNEPYPTTRSNAAGSPRHCCRMCGHSTRIISILSSMRPFIDTVLGGSGTDLGREQAGVAGVALSS